MSDKSTKTVQIAFRVTEAEKSAIIAAAEKDRRRMSDWVRITVTDAAAQQSN